MSSYVYQPWRQNPRNTGWGAAATAMKRVRRPAPRGSRPEEISPEEWARAEAQRYIDSLVADIESQRESYLADLEKQSKLEADRGAELARVLQGMNIPGLVSQIYGTAGDDIVGYAKGFSGQLQGIATADAAQQTRMLSGTGQEGAVRNQGENMGNVLYGAGGVIPGRSMKETGAAFASQAALEPAYAARIGQLKASEAYQEGLSGLDQFTEAITDARGQRLEIEQDLLGQRQDTIDAEYKAANAERDRQWKILKDERDYYLRQQYLALARGDKKRAAEYLKLAQIREQRMKDTQERIAANTKGLDENGNLLPGFKRDASGRIVKITAKPKTKTETPAQKAAAARKEREDEFREIRVQAIDEAGKLVTPATLTSPEKRPPYQVAFRKLWNLYKDWLRFAGPGGQAKMRSRLTKMIHDALVEAGFQATPGPPNIGG